MELSTYFRINEKNTGQFERTLIVVEDEVMSLIWKDVQLHKEMKINCMLLSLN